VNSMRVLLLPYHANFPYRIQAELWHDDRRMEKTTGNSCPRCGLGTLSIYYNDDSDLQLGAVCDSCGLRGFFNNGKLVQLAFA